MSLKLAAFGSVPYASFRAAFCPANAGFGVFRGKNRNGSSRKFLKEPLPRFH